MKPERITELAFQTTQCAAGGGPLLTVEQAITTAVREALEGAWTAVKDGLPDADITVLIELDDGEVWTGYHDGDDGWRYVSGDPVCSRVVGWMDLPEGRTGRA